MKALTYPVVVTPLAIEDGGGFLATVPDLPGCMSDGDTPEQAISNVMEAIEDWMETCRDMGRSIPEPSKSLRVAS